MKLKDVYVGEHFVMSGHYLYRKTSNGIVVAGGTRKNQLIGKEWPGMPQLDTEVTIVNPVKWSINHNYWENKCRH